MTSNLLGRREKLSYVLAPEFKTVARSHWKKEMACPITCQMWEKSLRRVTWASQLAWAPTQHLSHLSAWWHPGEDRKAGVGRLTSKMR